MCRALQGLNTLQTSSLVQGDKRAFAVFKGRGGGVGQMTLAALPATLSPRERLQHLQDLDQHKHRAK